MQKPLLLAILLLSVFIIPARSSSTQIPSETDSLQNISLQLKWSHAFQFAGFYAADLQGFYKDAGLSVEIRQRPNKETSLNLLLEGKADYAIANGSALLMSRLQGNPVKALAVIFQHSPNILLSRKTSNIRTPSDLIGKKVMFARGLSNLELKAMFIHEGISTESINIKQPSLQLGDLIDGRVDAMNAYITSGPYALKLKNIEPSFLQPVNYGVDFYGDTLCTTEKEIKDNPQRTEAFIKSSLKGWKYAFEHEEEIITYILNLPGVRERNITKEFLRNEALEMEKLIQPKLVELGHINPGRFTHIGNTFVTLGLIDAGFSIDGFIFDAEKKAQTKWLPLLGGVSAVFLFLIILGLFINRHLTRTVAERTKEYKESEQRFHDLVTLLPEMVWETDLTGKFTYVNKTALNHFGYESIPEDRDLYCMEMLIPEDREEAMESMKRVCRGEELGINEYTALTAGGKRFPVWIRSSAIITNNQVAGLRGIIIDISERRQLEDKLNQAQKMEAIGTLAGGIAHDFNNILTAILGYTELATLHMGDEAKVQKDLHHVRTGAIRARDLVAQILAFSRKSDSVVRLIEPVLIIKEALKLLRSSTPSTITFVQNLNSTSSIQIDPTQLHQIILNLCTNGIQAMEPNVGTLTINLTDIQTTDTDPLIPSELPPGTYQCLEITDNGSGMPEETKEMIFDPYFTTKELGKGTGLGLAVVHGIVKKYKGDITVHSSLGKGTSFFIYLPVVDEAKDIILSDTSVTKERNNHYQGNGQHILLIDDEEELVIMLKDLLVHSGYKVHTYTDSPQALTHFTNNRYAYDLVITDMTMPHLTGLKLSTEILALRDNLPIILMTGFSEQIDKEKAITAGIQCFLQKPPETAVLLKNIHELLNV